MRFCWSSVGTGVNPSGTSENATEYTPTALRLLTYTEKSNLNYGNKLRFFEYIALSFNNLSHKICHHLEVDNKRLQDKSAAMFQYS